MMNCNEVELMLADYLGNELPEEERRTVDSHLQRCAACAQQIETLQDTLTTLGHLDTISHGDAAHRTRDFQITRRPPAIQRIAIASLKIAAMLAFGVALGRWSQKQPTNSNPQTTDPSNTNPQMVAQAGSVSIHPDWLEFAAKLNRDSSGLAGPLRYLAKGLNR
jgi:anti-sigma factor RsiW